MLLIWTQSSPSFHWGSTLWWREHFCKAHCLQNLNFVLPMKSNYFLAFLEEAACVGCSPPSVHPSIHPVSHPSVYLSISIPLLAILSLFLYTVLGFNHCCNWQLPAVLTHTCIRFLCALLLQIPLAISYVCVSVRARVLVSVCVPARAFVCEGPGEGDMER